MGSLFPCPETWTKVCWITKSELLGLCMFSHLKTFITITDESGTIAPSTIIVEAEILAGLHNQDQDNLAALEQRHRGH